MSGSTADKASVSIKVSSTGIYWRSVSAFPPNLGSQVRGFRCWNGKPRGKGNAGRVNAEASVRSGLES